MFNTLHTNTFAPECAKMMVIQGDLYLSAHLILTQHPACSAYIHHKCYNKYYTPVTGGKTNPLNYAPSEASWFAYLL